MPTTTITIASLIAEHGERLEQCLEYDGLATMGPEAFIEALSTLSSVFVNSSSLYDEGVELASAVTYLCDALELDDTVPDKQVLFRKAEGHLHTVADLM